MKKSFRKLMETGIVQKVDYSVVDGLRWTVYYKTINFGDFDDLIEASDHLKQLLLLDKKSGYVLPSPKRNKKEKEIG